MRWTLNAIRQLKEEGKIRDYKILPWKDPLSLAPSAPPSKKEKVGKFLNKKVPYDGHVFDSHFERDRYAVLKLRERAGEIFDIRLQVEYVVELDGQRAFSYFADFVYRETARPDVEIVEDTKSERTRKLAGYRLKKRMLRQHLGIEIREIIPPPKAKTRRPKK